MNQVSPGMGKKGTGRTKDALWPKMREKWGRA